MSSDHCFDILEELSLVGLLLAYKSNAVSNSVGRDLVLCLEVSCRIAARPIALVTNFNISMTSGYLQVQCLYYNVKITQQSIELLLNTL
jgi:hypothetical protein